MNPNLKVVHEGDKFVIKDDEDGVYGSYGSKEEADAACADWIDYYARPLEAE